MKWTTDKPTENGRYLVQMDGDSEMDDMGGLIYDYGPYVDMCHIEVDPGDGSLIIKEMNGPIIEEAVLQWFGPIPEPKES